MSNLFLSLRAWLQTSRAPSVPAPAIQSTSATELPLDSLPLLPPGELLLRCRASVSRIEELAGTTPKHFAEYYLETLHRFARHAQQRPASQASHAHPGGMLALGLETAAAALRIRQAYLLPAGAVPEEAVLKKDRWTFAVFSAALLQDLAQPAVEQTLTLFDGGMARTWNPWTGPMADVPGVAAYRVERFEKHTPKLPSSASLLLAPSIIAPAGLAWLAGDGDVFSAWLACLTGEARQAGVLGEIIGKARQGFLLVAGPAGTAPIPPTEAETTADPAPPEEPSDIPLHEELLRGIRALIDDSKLPVNTVEASGWRTGEDVWLEATGVADALRIWLVKQGSTDIPGNNQTLIDVLHRENSLVPCEGKAVWRVIVDDSGAERTVAALRIEARRIWPDGEPAPADFAGTVTPAKPAPGEDAKGKEAPAEKFVEWLRKGIAEGRIPYNQEGAHIHIVPEGVLLVVPGLFQDFVGECGGGRWETVQQLFIKRKAHVRTEGGENIHHYVAEASQAALSGFLLKDASLVFGDGIPAPNPSICRQGENGL